MMSLWACLSGSHGVRESGYVTYWGPRRNPVPGSVVGPRDPGMYIVLGSRNAHASWCPEVRDSSTCSSMDSRAFEGWPQAAARMHLAPWLDHAACCRIAHAAWPRASAYTLQLGYIVPWYMPTSPNRVWTTPESRIAAPCSALKQEASVQRIKVVYKGHQRLDTSPCAGLL